MIDVLIIHDHSKLDCVKTIKRYDNIRLSVKKNDTGLDGLPAS